MELVTAIACIVAVVATVIAIDATARLRKLQDAVRADTWRRNGW